MPTGIQNSDATLLDLLQQRGAVSVSQLIEEMGVTATAVRQRLARLMAQGLIERKTTEGARGRPSHRYFLTARGRQRGGSNFADLALVLWHEIRAVRDPEVRSGLLQRIASLLAKQYAPHFADRAPSDRLSAMQSLFADRRVPIAIDGSSDLPIVAPLACPYPELAEQDRGICAVEKLLFSELLGHRMRLSACRLDGDDCCRFESVGMSGKQAVNRTQEAI